MKLLSYFLMCQFAVDIFVIEGTRKKKFSDLIWALWLLLLLRNVGTNIWFITWLAKKEYLYLSVCLSILLSFQLIVNPVSWLQDIRTQQLVNICQYSFYYKPRVEVNLGQSSKGACDQWQNDDRGGVSGTAYDLTENQKV